MDAWVYLFSKFTHEALLFEALALFFGLFGYAVFYLIRKRKYGVAGKEVPSNVMKVYLAQLMGDAEEIRTQLFGLLGKGEASARLMANLQFQADLPAASAAPGDGATLSGAPVATTQLVQDPKLTEKLKELEKKLSEQAGALDSVLNEKMKLEEELANAKNAAPAAGDPAAAADKGGADRTAPLQERVKQLEAQLAEYAIIEDDLANLKRLQKENKALKQRLADAGNAPAAEPSVEATAPATPVTEPAGPTLEPTLEAMAAAEAVAPAAAAEADHPGDFESLVDVVEKNLADAAKNETVGANDAPASEAKPDEKSEEQLQADFEKMLKS